MAGFNLNSGYGQQTALAIPSSKTTGQTFVVGKSSCAGIDIIKNIFVPSTDGVVRYAATLDTAIGYCTASRGDKIYILPGHTETISSATALALDVAGVNIIGLGEGQLKPTFTLDTANTATIAVSAANITITNCIFVANFLNIASLFTLTTAKGFGLYNCEFRDTSAILNFLRIVDTNTTTNDADDLTIVGCKRLGAGATTATTIIKMDGTNARLRVLNNYFTHANTDDGGLFMIIAAGKVVTDMECSGNVFNFVGTAAGTAGILITTNQSTNSGYLANNFVQSLDATSEILVTASSGLIFFQNFYSGAADKSGYLLPAADA